MLPFSPVQEKHENHKMQCAFCPRSTVGACRHVFQTASSPSKQSQPLLKTKRFYLRFYSLFPMKKTDTEGGTLNWYNSFRFNAECKFLLEQQLRMANWLLFWGMPSSVRRLSFSITSSPGWERAEQVHGRWGGGRGGAACWKQEVRGQQWPLVCNYQKQAPKYWLNIY